MKDKFNMIGRQFEKWTVLDFSDYKEKCSRDKFWLCRCECGTEKPVKACYLRNGQSKQCVDCAHENQRIKGRLIPRMYWEHLTKNASTRGIGFDLKQEQVIELLKKQNYKCSLSGLPIEFAKTESEQKQGKTTASIDRVDSSKPYVIENIQMVHKIINFMKHTLQQDQFITMCKLVFENSKSCNVSIPTNSTAPREEELNHE